MKRRGRGGGRIERVGSRRRGWRKKRRGDGGMVERRGLINETYAAAADTEMHCKYTVARKTIVPERDL